MSTMTRAERMRSMDRVLGRRLLPSHKRAVQPMIDLYVEMVEYVTELSDKKLNELELACRNHGQSNCWFRAYDAAGITLKIISDERAERNRAAANKDPSLK